MAVVSQDGIFQRTCDLLLWQKSIKIYRFVALKGLLTLCRKTDQRMYGGIPNLCTEGHTDIPVALSVKSRGVPVGLCRVVAECQLAPTVSGVRPSQLFTHREQIGSAIFAARGSFCSVHCGYLKYVRTAYSGGEITCISLTLDKTNSIFSSCASDRVLSPALFAPGSACFLNPRLRLSKTRNVPGKGRE